MKTCKDCLYRKICPLNLKGDEAEKCPSYEHKDEYAKVVRCKDCTHRDKTNWCKLHAMYTSDDEYCNRANPKGGAEECIH